MAKKERGKGKSSRTDIKPNARREAREALRPSLALGQSRHAFKAKGESGHIHSVGTLRTDRDALTQVAKWLHHQGLNLKHLNVSLAKTYVEERIARGLKPKTIAKDIRVLKRVLNQDIGVKIKIPKVTTPRAYLRREVKAIAAHMTPRNALATRIAYVAGLRAHELQTLARREERTPSERNWREERFSGREGVIYTVQGKGGLVREVNIPDYLAEELEACRLSTPIMVKDREILREIRYDIGGGKAWSGAFSRASKATLGWSSGGHGLRHSYAQERIYELQLEGHLYKQAKEIISQELGHFRPDITDVYLR